MDGKFGCLVAQLVVLLSWVKINTGPRLCEERLHTTTDHHIQAGQKLLQPATQCNDLDQTVMCIKMAHS